MPENMSIELMRLAVLTNIFPLYEVGNVEVFTQTVIPDEVLPVERYLGLQGRFKHLTDEDIGVYQQLVTRKFHRFKERFEKTKKGGEDQ
jgi:pyruvate/2-oxoacid:ferredoxin oxidoreductase beta subunit